MAEAREALSTSPSLTIEGFQHRFPDGRHLALPVDLRLFPGECALVTGATGSGKTSLLYAIAGLLPGHTEGIYTDPQVSVGLVFQNPGTQLFFSDVAEELAFAPRNRGLPEPVVESRIASYLEAVGLPGWEKRSIDGLSMGEKHRVAMAAACSAEPLLLLLDEPFAQLDTAGAARLRRLLSNYLEAGGTVVISEHHPELVAGIARCSLHLPTGDMPPLAPSIRNDTSTTPTVPRTDIDIRGLHLTVPDSDRWLLRDFSWQVSGGERIHVRGPNGSGKSSLLRALLGLQELESGHAEVTGRVPSPAALAGRVAFLHQDPDSQLSASSVREEVAFAWQRLPAEGRPPAGWIDWLMDSLGLAALARQSPLSLSYGEKHLVTLAAALACRPRLVLLDEPFAGLDQGRVRALCGFLLEYSRAYESTLVMASHNALPELGWATRQFVMEDGRFFEALQR